MQTDVEIHTEEKLVQLFLKRIQNSTHQQLTWVGSSGTSNQAERRISCGLRWVTGTLQEMMEVAVIVVAFNKQRMSSMAPFRSPCCLDSAARCRSAPLPLGLLVKARWRCLSLAVPEGYLA